MSKKVMNDVLARRLKHNLTQEALADAVGVSRQTIIAIEKGNYVPSVLLALELASYFKCPLERLFWYN